MSEKINFQTLTVRDLLKQLLSHFEGDLDAPVYVGLGAPGENLPWRKIAYLEVQNSGVGTSQVVVRACRSGV